MVDQDAVVAVVGVDVVNDSLGLDDEYRVRSAMVAYASTNAVMVLAFDEIGPGVGVQGAGRSQAARLFDRFVSVGIGVLYRGMPGR